MCFFFLTYAKFGYNFGYQSYAIVEIARYTTNEINRLQGHLFYTSFSIILSILYFFELLTRDVFKRVFHICQVHKHKHASFHALLVFYVYTLVELKPVGWGV